MIVYRVAKSKYIKDLSGEGSRLNGSRWAPQGVPVLYASGSRALAILEFYVHMSPDYAPANVALATIEIPDSVVPFVLDPGTLPLFWKDYPAPPAIQIIGADLFASGYPVLQVPSVIVPHEFNLAIDISHPRRPTIELVSVEDLYLDQRLVSKA